VDAIEEVEHEVDAERGDIGGQGAHHLGIAKSVEEVGEEGIEVGDPVVVAVLDPVEKSVDGAELLPTHGAGSERAVVGEK